MQFPQYIENRSVVLVGPAPTLIGQGALKFIEDFDVVVRCNNGCPIPKLFQRDYGKRCDVLYLNQVTLSIKRRLPIKTYQKCGVKFLRLKTTVGHDLKKINKLIPSEDIQTEFKKVSQLIHNTAPLIGHVAICDILRCRPKNLHIMGVDFYLNPGSEYISKYSLHGYNRQRDLRYHEPILALQDILEKYDRSNKGIITVDTHIENIFNCARGADVSYYIDKECKIAIVNKRQNPRYVWCKIVPGKIGYNTVSLKIVGSKKYIRHCNFKLLSDNLGHRYIDLMDASFIVDQRLSDQKTLGLRAVNYMPWNLTTTGALGKHAKDDVAKFKIR